MTRKGRRMVIVLASLAGVGSAAALTQTILARAGLPSPACVSPSPVSDWPSLNESPIS